MFVALFVLVIVGAIIIHEFGHFATAKLFGMKATRFFVGFGPTLWSTRRGETEYGVKAIPAGGFVKIVGMTPWEEADPADDGRLFYQQPAWKRLIVLSAGSATHLVIALLLLVGALAFIGLPTGEATTQVQAISADSPAAAAGLRPGDTITAVDGQPTATFDEVRAAVGDRFGDTVSLTVERRGDAVELEATLDVPHPDPEQAGVGFLGVAPRSVEEPLGVVDGTRVALFPSASEALLGEGRDLSFAFLTTSTVDGLVQVFSLDGLGRFFGSLDGDEPRAADSVTSLVGAGQIVNEFGEQGDIFAVLLVLAQLNLVLGILNMLPLPPLDGGHVAVMAVEEAVNGVRRLRRGDRQPRFHLNPSVVTPIALAVIGFFLVLTTTALYLDITSPASQLLQ
jgi:membrane-associated protease RseP (regulator of RpoE activity)